VGYCSLLIKIYTLKTKDLYSKLLEKETDPLYWKPEEIQIAESLKQHLVVAPVLVLPSLENLSTFWLM
jgi:hypothetical protein